MVSAGDLQHRYGGQEDSGKRMAPGLLIGCHIDTSTGLLSFTVNGKDVANKFQVEPGAMLFPAVFCEPTNKEMFQFELGRMKVLSHTLHGNGYRKSRRSVIQKLTLKFQCKIGGFEYINGKSEVPF